MKLRIPIRIRIREAGPTRKGAQPGQCDGARGGTQRRVYCAILLRF